VNLLVPAYPHPDRARRGEIELCLRANLANAEFSRVLLFGDAGHFASHPRLTVIPGTDRPTFAQLFAAAANFPGQICAVANADIYFDGTIALASALEVGELYALSRWCPETQRICPVGSVGADAWLFRAPLPAALLTLLLTQPRAIRFGMPFCDVRLARLFADAGATASNPSLTIRAWHSHASAVRTCTHADTIPGPYASHPPCALPVGG